MAENQALALERLDHFEAEWRSGAVPDVRKYLAERELDSESLAHFIELDLEYRWKRYRAENGPPANAVDVHGFPEFPALEDYARIEAVSAGCVFTARLAAEEYRVRTRWGDEPARKRYLMRFELPPDAVQEAIERVETELNNEGTLSSTIAERPSKSHGTSSTIGFDQVGDSESGRGPSRTVPQFLDHFRLEEVIGRGGFGEVWKAFDTKLKQHVAVKIPRPDRAYPPSTLDDFKKEGEKLAEIRDLDGVAAVYHAGECAGHPYLVSRLIDGENLAQRLERDPLPYDEVAGLVAAVARILHRAHKKDLVHRDVKAENILLDAEERPFLTDFGLAVSEREQRLEAPTVLGTCAYMSPEQARGQNRLVDARTDIYSLGIVLYRALTGRFPYLADTAAEYKDQILDKAPRPPRTIDDAIPARLEQICLKCVAKNVDDRYTTALDLARDLERWKRGGTSANRRRAAIVAAVATVAVLLSALGVWRPWHGPDTTAYPGPSGGVQEAWRNLLKKPPRKVLWDPRVPLHSFGNPGDDQRMPIRTTGFAAFSLGDNQQEDFEFRMRFIVEDWNGSIGVFWGLSQSPHATEHKYQLQTLRVERVSADLLQFRVVEYACDEIPTTSFPSGRNLSERFGSIPVDSLETGREVELKVAANQGKLVGLTIGGQEIPVDGVRLRSKINHRGEVGVICLDGYYVVTAAWLKMGDD